MGSRVGEKMFRLANYLANLEDPANPKNIERKNMKIRQYEFRIMGNWGAEYGNDILYFLPLLKNGPYRYSN